MTSIGGLPNDKMGANDGIDGRILLPNKEIAIVSVKSGNVTVDQVRALKGLLNGKNKIGIFITKNNPTRGMVEFASRSGIYVPQKPYSSQSTVRAYNPDSDFGTDIERRTAGTAIRKEQRCMR